jgi:hypothetical protein
VLSALSLQGSLLEVVVPRPECAVLLIAYIYNVLGYFTFKRFPIRVKFLLMQASLFRSGDHWSFLEV